MRLEESPHKEKVPRKKVCAVIYRYLKEDLQGNPRPLRSLILRRDGKAFTEEWLGFRDAVNKLIQENLLPKDIRIGVVEVHKKFALGLRLVTEDGLGRLTNPPSEAGENSITERRSSARPVFRSASTGL